MTLNSVAPEPDKSAAPTPNSSPISSTTLLKYLRKAQQYSAYGIATFAGLHLTATLVLPPISVDAANSMLMFGRTIYQSTLGEAVFVLLPFGVHILSGALARAILIYKRWRDSGKLNFGKVTPTQASGFALTILTLGHYLALRRGPAVMLGDSSLISLDYITYHLQTEPQKTGPALVLIVAAFAGHAVWGANQYLRLRLKPKTKNWLVGGILALLGASLLTLRGRPPLAGWIAEQYHLAGTYMG